MLSVEYPAMSRALEGQATAAQRRELEGTLNRGELWGTWRVLTTGTKVNLAVVGCTLGYSRDYTHARAYAAELFGFSGFERKFSLRRCKFALNPHNPRTKSA